MREVWFKNFYQNLLIKISSVSDVDVAIILLYKFYIHFHGFKWNVGISHIFCFQDIIFLWKMRALFIYFWWSKCKLPSYTLGWGSLFIIFILIIRFYSRFIHLFTLLLYFIYQMMFTKIKPILLIVLWSPNLNLFNLCVCILCVYTILTSLILFLHL